MRLATSSCPNDTYMLAPWIHGSVKTSLQIEPEYHDIETLNELAIENTFPFMKVSIGVLPRISDHYQLLPCGLAAGFNVGPLLITKEKNQSKDPSTLKIATPGINTTACALFKRFYPKAEEVVHLPYHKILEAIQSEEVEGGIIIHETRFTFKQEGLKCHSDLGKMWQSQSKLPLPLGAYVAQRNLEKETLQAFVAAFKQSLTQAWLRPKQYLPYIQKHSQEKNLSVIEDHIKLYVNSESYGFSESMKTAISELCQTLTPSLA